MINLQFQYKPLFKIKVNHNFYPENPANDFYIIPTKRTVKLIDEMSMLVKSRDGEIHVLFDASKLELLHHRLNNSSDADSKLSFLLFSNNPYFVNVTDIPTDLNNKVFYCSNKKTGTQKEGKLHDNEFIDSGDLFNVIPQELNDNEEGKVDYKISLEKGNIEEDVPAINVNKGFQVDVNSLIEGHYKIFGNEKELSSFINIGARTKGSPIGFIDIFLNKKIKEQIIEEIENNDIGTFTYHINFNARSIFWKYIVVPTYIKRLKKLSVNCQKGQNKLLFKSLGEENIDGKKAFSFMSEETVQLKKFYDYEVQLKREEGENGGKVLIKKMSFAAFDILKPVDEKNYMSEIYVYI